MGWIADLLQEIPSAARYKIQLEQMAAENTKLKAKIAVLESKLLTADEKIRHHVETIKKQSTDIHDQLLDVMQVEILKLLYNKPNLTPEQIQQFLKTELEAIRFHLAELSAQKMVQTDTFGSYPTYQVWLLAQEGRRYVIEHKLTS